MSSDETDIQNAPNSMLNHAEILLSHATHYFEKDYAAVCQAITQFEQDCKSDHYNDALIDDTKFFLCAYLDEICTWQNPLLKKFFTETTKKDYEFYERLEKRRGDVNANLDCLEFGYICLSLGFQGKYRHDPDGNSVINYMESLYSDIRDKRHDSSNQLSEIKTEVDQHFWRLPPVWVTIIVAIAVLVSIYWSYNSELTKSAIPTEKMLKTAISNKVDNSTSTTSTGQSR